MAEPRPTHRARLQQRVARVLGRPDTQAPTSGAASERRGRGAASARPVGPARPRRDTPVNVAGQLPLPLGRDLRLAVVAIARNEAPYLEEWLCYHMAVGVEHVFLYDNGSTDATREVLEPYQNHGLVTVVDWPLPGSQTSAYSHALRFFGPSVDWLAFHDVDEFLVPIHDDDVPSVLARFEDAAILQVPRREFGFSGHRSPPDGLTIEAYTGIAHTADRDALPGPRVKALVQPSGVFAVEIHAATLADRFPDGVDARGRPYPRRVVQGKRLEDVIQLNHYYTRSFEEFEAKRFRGSATGRIARPPIPFDTPTLETDTRAHRFVGRTRAMIERVRSLEPRPYVYGSELAVPELPVFDDLGRFAEFAIANMAAGLAEAGRGPAMRFPNLWSRVGFVADLTATGFRPTPAAFSASQHAAALFEHMRGRLDASLVDVVIEEGSLQPGDGTGGLASLHLADGRARLSFRLGLGGRRRCAAVGFVLGAPAPLQLRAEVTADDDPSAAGATTFDLPSGEVLAGIVEVASRPALLSAVTISVEGAAEEVVLADLFVVTYG